MVEQKSTLQSRVMKVRPDTTGIFCAAHFLERVGGIDRSPLPSGGSGLGLRSTATGSRPRPFDSQGKTITSPTSSSTVKHNLVERVGGIEPPIQPWEGRVLPLNHTRRRLAVYAVAVLLASAFVFARPIQAEETPTVTAPIHFDESLISTGWTLRLDSGANLTVFPGVLPAPADVAWVTASNLTPTLPANTAQLGGLYRLTISGVTTLNTEKWKLAAALPDAPSLWQKSVWLYDISAKTWTKLPSKLNGRTFKWQAGFALTDAYVTILEDRNVQQGTASWYCKKSCAAKYPRLHGTSNDYPVGSKVTVTNLENGKSVTVKIVSGWGQPDGRVVDLSWPAYYQLRASNKGLTRVRVTPAAGTTTLAVPTVSETETLPALQVTTASAVEPPAVTGAAYTVIDAGTGKVLADNNSTATRPIASLTKLMTAMVVLDTKPSLGKIITYRQADVTPYAYLRVKPGETLSIKDLFYSMLVGSANNAATALARSTGLTRAQFLAAMNAKAANFGATHTKFVDLNGLDPNNVSTAEDIAVIANHAFHDYALIRKATVTKTYTFATANTKVKHTIKTTDKLLGQDSGLTITGGKTGFIDEAQYTYVLRTKNNQGAQVIVTLLGSPTSSQRFADAAKLSTWAWSSYRWN